MLKASDKKHLAKDCSIWGKLMDVIVYRNHSYRGGHYFGKVPISSKKEMSKAMKSGTRTMLVGDMKVQVINRDPKPYDYFEYWECPACYWGGK